MIIIMTAFFECILFGRQFSYIIFKSTKTLKTSIIIPIF